MEGIGFLLDDDDGGGHGGGGGGGGGGGDDDDDAAPREAASPPPSPQTPATFRILAVERWPLLPHCLAIQEGVTMCANEQINPRHLRGKLQVHIVAYIQAAAAEGASGAFVPTGLDFGAQWKFSIKCEV